MSEEVCVLEGLSAFCFGLKHATCNASPCKQQTVLRGCLARDALINQHAQALGRHFVLVQWALFHLDILSLFLLPYLSKESTGWYFCRTDHRVSVLCASGRKAEEAGVCCCRYTSYGRHFTEAGHLVALNEFLLPYLQDQDTVVDFSCGANVWVPMLKTACLQQGIVRLTAPCRWTSNTSLTHDRLTEPGVGCSYVKSIASAIARAFQHSYCPLIYI